MLYYISYILYSICIYYLHHIIHDQTCVHKCVYNIDDMYMHGICKAYMYVYVYMYIYLYTCVYIYDIKHIMLYDMIYYRTV